VRHDTADAHRPQSTPLLLDIDEKRVRSIQLIAPSAHKNGSFEQFMGRKRHDFREYLALGESHDVIWMRKLAEIRPPGGDSDTPPELALRYACSRANPA